MKILTLQWKYRRISFIILPNKKIGYQSTLQFNMVLSNFLRLALILTVSVSYQVKQRDVKGIFTEEVNKMKFVNDTAHVLCNVTTFSKILCTHHCIAIRGCAAVNYNTKTSTCECLTEDILRDTSSVSSNEWIYVEIKQINTTVGK